MTIAMEFLHRQLPVSQQYALPPREITGKIARKLHLDRRLDERTWTALTLVNHFAYGSACGALYGGVLSEVKIPFVVKGLLFGTVVWGMSYLGVLPLAGVLKSARKHPVGRNLLMVAVHLVWGLVLAAFVETVGPEQRSRPLAALGRWSPLGHRDAR